MNEIRELFDNLYVHEILTSAVFIVALIILRIIMIRVIKHGRDTLSKDQRRWIVLAKNAAITLGLIGLIMIWAPQLQTLALSLTAVMVAIVIALKEVILCITGGFVRVTTTPFRVGDWIIFDGHAGEVVDIDAFTVRLQEVDLTNSNFKFTGRMITVPNSKLFTANITNLNVSRRGHMFLDVSVKIPHNDIDPVRLMNDFKTIVESVHNDLHQPEGDSAVRSVKKTGMGTSSSDPLVSLQTTDLGHYITSVRLYVPVEKAQETSTNITTRLVSTAYQQRLDANAEENTAEEE